MCYENFFTFEEVSIGSKLPFLPKFIGTRCYIPIPQRLTLIVNLRKSPETLFRKASGEQLFPNNQLPPQFDCFSVSCVLPAGSTQVCA